MDRRRLVSIGGLILLLRLACCDRGEKEELRLVGGSSACEGRVEVKHRGKWGTVCGLNWSRKSAAVVCRQAGCPFTNEGQVKAASFGAGSGPVWLSHVTCAGEESTLWDCQHRMWGSGQCKHRDDAGVICSGAPSELRLVGGANKCEGRLEVKHQGEWGTVCGNYWQEKEAVVVCRQLGCSPSHEEPRLIRGSFFGPGSDKIWLSDVSCSGEEEELWQCKHQMWGNPFCLHSWDVGVTCAGDPKELKLVGGKTACEGRLMVKHRGEWGSVCGDFWNVAEARVVCRQLGCGRPQEAGGQAKVTNAEAGTGRVWLSQVRCTGEEGSLTQCRHQMWGLGGCGRRSDVWVTCEDPKTVARAVSDPECCNTRAEESGLSTHVCNHEKMKQKQCAACGWCNARGNIVNFEIEIGSEKCSGKVLMCLGPTCRPLCADLWRHGAANVLCQQLKCGGVASAGRASETEQDRLFWNAALFCQGSESNLGECLMFRDKRRTCKTCTAAHVNCTGPDKKVTLRLHDDFQICTGKVERLHEGSWVGVLLHHQWSLKEAGVVCRQLHCGHAIEWFSTEEPASGALAWSISCEGHEEDIEICSISRVNPSASSGHPLKYVGVTCSESISVRLVESRDRCGGVVELYHQGKWGLVSAEAWNLKDGGVVCRELDCGHIIAAEGKSVESSGKRWMSDVTCEGNERALRDCPSGSWETSHSVEKEAATVICSEFTELRLVGGADSCEGRLEIFYNGTWGSVCSNQMSGHSPTIICKELKCGTSGRLEAPLKYGPGAAPYWLDLVDCGMEEKSLAVCQSAPWGENDCRADQVAQIKCEKSETST